MRLLHLTEFYALVGGLEQYLLSVSEALEAAGHRVVVAYGARTGRETDPEARPAFHLPELAGPRPAPRSSLRQLAELLVREAPDVIMIHEIQDPRVVRLAAARAPTLRFAHGHKLACPGGRRLWQPVGRVCERPLGVGCQARAYLHRCMPRDIRRGLPLILRAQAVLRLHRRWSQLVVPSRFVRGLMLQNDFPPEQVHLAPYFTRLPEPPAPPRDAVPGRILCAARLVAEKGVEHVLEVLGGLPPPAHLVVAGDGPARAGLESRARELSLGDRVQFLGWLGSERMGSALESAQVVVVPSIWPETFGIIGIEAMARARPVVAYDSGGVREWLGHGETGLLVARGDTGGLGAALGGLLRDPARCEALGAQGRRRVAAEFLAEHHLAALLQAAAAAAARFGAKP